MALRLLLLTSTLLVASQVRAQVLSKRATGATGAPSRYIFVFGDSYTTTGFNASLQPQPSLEDPLGNPAYPGTTLSGGPNWVDVMIYNHSLAGTVAYDYGVGGNTVNHTRMPKGDPGSPGPVRDFINQEAEFEALFNVNSEIHNATDTLFIAWFGINDVAIQISNGLSLSQSERILAPDIKDYFGILDRLYGYGARNFLTILVPPIYRAPAYGHATSSRARAIKNATKFWNDQIQARNTAFQKQYTKLNSQIIDPSPIFNQILDHPHENGAPNSTCFSYPAGKPCLWHDFIHPGLVIQEAFGNVMGDITSSMGF